MPRSIGVFLCDDVPELRALLRAGLEGERDISIVGEAGDAEEALGAMPDVQPDVLLLDLSLPGMDGLEAIPRVRATVPGTAIVVLSALDAEHMRDQCLAAGAEDYLEKGADLPTIAATVRQVVAAHDGR